MKKTPYLCTRLQKARAFSSAGLEHLPYKQRVGGSNPSTPTAYGRRTLCGGFLFSYVAVSGVLQPRCRQGMTY